MDHEELLDLHLSVAELHDYLLAFAEVAETMSADMAAVFKWLDDARGRLLNRHYPHAVQALASAAKAIAGTDKAEGRQSSRVGYKRCPRQKKAAPKSGQIQGRKEAYKNAMRRIVAL